MSRARGCGLRDSAWGGCPHPHPHPLPCPQRLSQAEPGSVACVLTAGTSHTSICPRRPDWVRGAGPAGDPSSSCDPVSSEIVIRAHHGHGGHRCLLPRDQGPCQLGPCRPMAVGKKRCSVVTYKTMVSSLPLVQLRGSVSGVAQPPGFAVLVPVGLGLRVGVGQCLLVLCSQEAGAVGTKRVWCDLDRPYAWSQVPGVCRRTRCCCFQSPVDAH